MWATKKIYVYSVCPIDDWTGWRHMNDIEVDCADEFCTFSFDEMREIVEACKKLAVKAGWEGDVREGPFFSAIPAGSGNLTTFIVAWKHDANGTCFICSPYCLPWLEKGEEYEAFQGVVGSAPSIYRKLREPSFKKRAGSWEAS